MGACAPGGDGPGLLGLRVPALTGPLSALATVNLPAAQSSANFTGAANPRTLAEVPSQLRDGVDLVIDGGDLPGTASTLLDVSEYEKTGRWNILRAGPVGACSLARALD
jgi:L-threonylcarbamoyladenylate synthase